MEEGDAVPVDDLEFCHISITLTLTESVYSIANIIVFNYRTAGICWTQRIKENLSFK